MGHRTFGRDDDGSRLDDGSVSEGHLAGRHMANFGRQVNPRRRDARGELLGKTLHTAGWNCCVALGEHAEHDVEHAAGRREIGIELYAADERSEEPVEHGGCEAGLDEHRARGLVVTS